MISRLFVLLIACSIAYVALGVDGVVNHQSNSAQLRNAKSYKQYSTASLDTPTAKPTQKAKASPTAKPVASPTAVPIVETAEPTADPIADPTLAPTYHPTEQPVANPTANPIADPTLAPTYLPTEQPVANPTANPIADPTLAPTYHPTEQPVANPTANPIADPTLAPTYHPTEQPVANPTMNPIADPTLAPTYHPTERPIAQPTYLPSEKPVAVPTYAPTFKPSEVPSAAPSLAIVPTQKPHRPINCKVVIIIIRIAYWWYIHHPHGCNSVLKNAIVAAIKGIAIGNVQDPVVTEAILSAENGNLRVSVQEDAPDAISVEVTISVDADSGLTYDDISTQLVSSVESNEFNTILQQYAVAQNVTGLADATTLSIETTDVTVNTDISARNGSDALGSDAIVGIAIGVCAALFVAAYLGRRYVASRAAKESSLETADSKNLLTSGRLSGDESNAWTDNPLGPSPAPNSVTVA